MATDITLKTSLCALLGVLSLESVSGEWEFKPSVGVEGIYSDNISRQGIEKESGYVNQTYFQLDNRYQSKNAQLGFNYKGTYASYDGDTSSDQSYNAFNGNGYLTLWEGGPRLVFSGEVSNVSRNTQLNSIASIANANTVERRSYNAGIAYSKTTRYLTLDAAAFKSNTSTDDNIGERDGENFTLTLKSGRNPKNLIWDISGKLNNFTSRNRSAKQYLIDAVIGYRLPYKINPIIGFSKEDASGDIATPRRFSTNYVGLGVNWLVTRQLQIDLSYNESINNIDEGDRFWTAKVSWEPSRRTSLYAQRSERFYGDSYEFKFEHTNKRWTNSITYTEQLQAFNRDYFFSEVQGYYYCPIIEEGETSSLDNCLGIEDILDAENYQLVTIFSNDLIENNEFVLDKAMSWQSNFVLRRFSARMRLSHNDLDYLSSGRSGQRESASLTLSRNISAKSTISVSSSYNKNIFNFDNSESGQVNRYRQHQISLSKTFGKTLDVSFAVKNIDRLSNLANLTYEENQVSINLKKLF